jgi:hypothetical protein
MKLNPIHTVHKERPEPPPRLSWWRQWKREWACRKTGGHWWHSDRMNVAEWFCCQCGALRNGMSQKWKRV